MLFIFLFLFLVLGATALIPVHSVMAAPDSAVRDTTVYHLFNNPNDYKWQGGWDPMWDPDFLIHQGAFGVHDMDVANSPPGQCRPY